MEHLWEFVVQGQLDQAGGPTNKELICFPSNAVDRAAAHGVLCQCSRGRRLDSRVPNQDDLLLAMCSCADQGRVGLYGVFDGHGPNGHHCAAVVRSYLPECIFSNPLLLTRPREVLKQAFEQAQKMLTKQPLDINSSGTTATLALLLDVRCPLEEEAELEEPGDASGTWIFIAHVGDSRAILASRKDEAVSDSLGSNAELEVTCLTRDHRPEDEAECDRLRQHGAEIRTPARGSGGAARVYMPGQSNPVSALTRSFGSSAAAEFGVVAAAEISARPIVRDQDLLLVLGTDGLFEFCSSHEVVSEFLRLGANAAALEATCAKARRRWVRNSHSGTFDDITAISVSLAPFWRQ